MENRVFNEALLVVVFVAGVDDLGVKDDAGGLPQHLADALNHREPLDDPDFLPTVADLDVFFVGDERSFAAVGEQSILGGLHDGDQKRLPIGLEQARLVLDGGDRHPREHLRRDAGRQHLGIFAGPGVEIVAQDDERMFLLRLLDLGVHFGCSVGSGRICASSRSAARFTLA